MKITLLDYEAGNLFSLARALSTNSANDVSIKTANKSLFNDTDLLILPGVGAFGHAMESISIVADEIQSKADNGFPMLGICLGMQVMFQSSEESAGVTGLSLMSGEVSRIKADRVPQLGWNQVNLEDKVFGPTYDGHYYFANSFACRPQDESVVIANTDYDADSFPTMVRKNNVIGTQFHPEKSSKLGLGLLNKIISELSQS